MDEQRYTVVVSSCDSYSDLWYPFFKILKAEWKELEEKRIPIVLNTESETYSYEGLNIKTMQFYKEGDNPPWTTRLRRTLEAIDTEYIIFLLDDFYMHDRVKAEKIEKHMQWMDENPRISMFCYKETYVSKNIRDNKYEGFERRPLIAQYKYNCQAALWRRKRFISYLKRDESPWEWEVFGNWRSYRHPFHLFYSHIPGMERVFPYIYGDGRTVWESGVFRGRWVVPTVEDIFMRHGIDIDYSIRGVVSPEELSQLRKVEKSKEDAPKWKQALWGLRPIYMAVKNTPSKFIYVMKHIKYFF